MIWAILVLVEILAFAAVFVAGTIYGKKEAAKGLQLIHQVLAKIESKL